MAEQTTVNRWGCSSTLHKRAWGFSIEGIMSHLQCEESGAVPLSSTMTLWYMGITSACHAEK